MDRDHSGGSPPVHGDRGMAWDELTRQRRHVSDGERRQHAQAAAGRHGEGRGKVEGLTGDDDDWRGEGGDDSDKGRTGSGANSGRR